MNRSDSKITKSLISEGNQLSLLSLNGNSDYIFPIPEDLKEVFPEEVEYIDFNVVDTIDHVPGYLTLLYTDYCDLRCRNCWRYPSSCMCDKPQHTLKAKETLAKLYKRFTTLSDRYVRLLDSCYYRLIYESIHFLPTLKIKGYYYDVQCPVFPISNKSPDKLIEILVKLVNTGIFSGKFRRSKVRRSLILYIVSGQFKLPFNHQTNLFVTSRKSLKIEVNLISNYCSPLWSFIKGKELPINMNMLKGVREKVPNAANVAIKKVKSYVPSSLQINIFKEVFKDQIPHFTTYLDAGVAAGLTTSMIVLSRPEIVGNTLFDLSGLDTAVLAGFTGYCFYKSVQSLLSVDSSVHMKHLFKGIIAEIKSKFKGTPFVNSIILNLEYFYNNLPDALGFYKFPVFVLGSIFIFTFFVKLCSKLMNYFTSHTPSSLKMNSPGSATIAPIFGAVVVGFCSLIGQSRLGFTMYRLVVDVVRSGTSYFSEKMIKSTLNAMTSTINGEEYFTIEDDKFLQELDQFIKDKENPAFENSILQSPLSISYFRNRAAIFLSEAPEKMVPGGKYHHFRADIKAVTLWLNRLFRKLVANPLYAKCSKPIVIGLFGPPGTGKSMFIKVIASFLKELYQRNGTPVDDANFIYEGAAPGSEYYDNYAGQEIFCFKEFCQIKSSEANSVTASTLIHAADGRALLNMADVTQKGKICTSKFLIVDSNSFTEREGFLNSGVDTLALDRRFHIKGGIESKGQVDFNKEGQDLYDEFAEKVFFVPACGPSNIRKHNYGYQDVFSDIATNQKADKLVPIGEFFRRLKDLFMSTHQNIEEAAIANIDFSKVFETVSMNMKTVKEDKGKDKEHELPAGHSNSSKSSSSYSTVEESSIESNMEELVKVSDTTSSMDSVSDHSVLEPKGKVWPATRKLAHQVAPTVFEDPDQMKQRTAHINHTDEKQMSDIVTNLELPIDNDVLLLRSVYAYMEFEPIHELGALLMKLLEKNMHYTDPLLKLLMSTHNEFENSFSFKQCENPNCAFEICSVDQRFLPNLKFNRRRSLTKCSMCTFGEYGHNKRMIRLRYHPSMKGVFTISDNLKKHEDILDSYSHSKSIYLSRGILDFYTEKRPPNRYSTDTHCYSVKYQDYVKIAQDKVKVIGKTKYGHSMYYDIQYVKPCTLGDLWHNFTVFICGNWKTTLVATATMLTINELVNRFFTDNMSTSIESITTNHAQYQHDKRRIKPKAQPLHAKPNVKVVTLDQNISTNAKMLTGLIDGEDCRVIYMNDSDDIYPKANMVNKEIVDIDLRLNFSQISINNQKQKIYRNILEFGLMTEEKGDYIIANILMINNTMGFICKHFLSLGEIIKVSIGGVWYTRDSVGFVEKDNQEAVLLYIKSKALAVSGVRKLKCIPATLQDIPNTDEGYSQYLYKNKTETKHQICETPLMSHKVINYHVGKDGKGSTLCDTLFSIRVPVTVEFKGFCSNPLLTYGRSSRFMLNYIHYSDNGNWSYATPVTMDYVDKVPKAYQFDMEVEDPYQVVKMNAKLINNFDHFPGTVPLGVVKEGASPYCKNIYRKSEIYDDSEPSLPDVGLDFAVTEPSDPSHYIIYDMNRLDESEPYLRDGTFLNIIEENLPDVMDGFCPIKKLGKNPIKDVPSKDELVPLIVGFGNTPGLDNTTTVGKYLKTKGFTGRTTGSKPCWNVEGEVTDEFYKEFSEYFEYQKTSCSSPVSVPRLKTEMRDPSKKTRVYYQGCLLDILYSKLILNEYVSHSVKNRDVGAGQLGMNPFGVDWDNLYHSVKTYRTVSDGDYKGLDRSTPSCISHFFFLYMLMFYKYAPGTLEYHHLQNACYKALNPIIWLFKRLYFTSGLNPSGSFLTTILNNFTVWFSHASTFYMLTRARFSSHCFIKVYGDDHLFMKNCIIDLDLFYLAMLRIHGLKVTPACKEGKFKDIDTRELHNSSVVFLKRNFRLLQQGEVTLLRSPIEINSIHKALLYRKESKESLDVVWSSVMESVTIELAQHPQEVYDEFVRLYSHRLLNLHCYAKEMPDYFTVTHRFSGIRYSSTAVKPIHQVGYGDDVYTFSH